MSDNAWRLERLRAEIEAQSDRVSDLLDSEEENPSKLALAAQATATRILESLGRHEQRIQNGMLKALKTLQALQKQALQEQAREAAQAKSGFVPTPQNKTASAAAGNPPNHPETTPITPFESAPQEHKAAA